MVTALRIRIKDRAATLVFFVLFWNYGFTQLQPEHLTVEYVENPLGIDTKHPRLSWKYPASSKEQLQRTYEIIVSDNVSDLQSHSGNVWATGTVTSSKNILIEYAGQDLKSFTRYYWSVRAGNQRNELSAWSAPAWFETAMIDQHDWTALWIGDGSKRPKDDEAYLDDPMPLLRRDFKVSKKILSARLYICGLGYYEAYLNGSKVGDRVLDPGWTTYRKQVLYSTYDVTGMIASGNNAIGIMLGNGWWNPLPFKFFGRWDLRDFQQTDRPTVIAEIHIRYADGSIEKIKTDESWMTTAGPVVRNNVYLGEHYDARKEVKDWSSNKSNTSVGWRQAVVTKGPDGRLSAQMQPPIRVTKIVKPTSVKEVKPGVFIVDMGQNFAGVAQLKVKGTAGTKITLRYGEGLFGDGSLNVMTTVATQIKKGGIKGGPGAPETAWQEDSYTLKGDGVEIWSPRFTFHGFRYVEVSGWPGRPTVSDIAGLRMNSDLSPMGSFSCSNEMLNKIHDVVNWTFLSNVFSVQSDCPGREKMGYGADMVVSANAFIYNFDMINFYRKAVTDFANEQRPLGGITEIAPFTGIDDRGYGDQSGPMGWQLGYCFLQKQLYDFYGDLKIIADNYGPFQKQIDFLKSQAKNNLFYWDISDHEALEPKPESFSASVFYYHHVLLAAEFAGLLNKTEDSVKYAKLHQQIKRSIVEKYYVAGTGRFDNGTEAAQILGLWYNLSPEKEKSINWLYEELKRNEFHLTTGIFSTKMFFDVMRDQDDGSLAFDVVNQKTYPGWGFMVDQGATTLWETWKFPETGPSRNHPMFGSVDEWFYRSVLGINAASAGFEKIIVKPQVTGKLLWAKGSYESVHGKIASDWKLDGDQFTFNVEIPGNTTAEIWIPSAPAATVLESGEPLKSAVYKNGYTIVGVGSGKFKFTSTVK